MSGVDFVTSPIGKDQGISGLFDSGIKQGYFPDAPCFDWKKEVLL